MNINRKKADIHPKVQNRTNQNILADKNCPRETNCEAEEHRRNSPN